MAADAPRPVDRDGKFIAVANMKGGVGKTTTVVSLAEALAADDEATRVLIVDLDPQSSASMAMAGDALLTEMINDQRTLEYLLEERLINGNRVDVSDLVQERVSETWHAGRQLDVGLLPCGPHLRVVERDLIYELAKSNHSSTAIDGKINRLFQTHINPLAKDFDFILFDCAPGISPVTEMAIRLSDVVLVPTVPDYISVFGLNAFYESIWKVGMPSSPKPKSIPHILITRMQKNIRQHADVLESLKEQTSQPRCGYKLLKQQIPTSAALVDALMKNGGLTLVQKYSPHVVAEVLVPLVAEMKGLFGWR